MNRKVIFIMSSAVFAISCMASMVYASTTPTATFGVVWTTDGSGNAKVLFDINEKVYIHWVADGSVSIKVESMSTIYGPWFQSSTSGIKDFQPTELGLHKVSCTGANVVEIAVGKFNVVPDLPFGSLMAAIACLAAFAMVFSRKRFSKW